MRQELVVLRCYPTSDVHERCCQGHCFYWHTAQTPLCYSHPTQITACAWYSFQVLRHQPHKSARIHSMVLCPMGDEYSIDREYTLHLHSVWGDIRRSSLFRILVDSSCFLSHSQLLQLSLEADGFRCSVKLIQWCYYWIWAEESGRREYIKHHGHRNGFSHHSSHNQRVTIDILSISSSDSSCVLLFSSAPSWAS